MSFIKKADEVLIGIKERANKEVKEYGDKYRKVHSRVMDIHTDRINGSDGPKYMKKCLEEGVVNNKGLVADYLAEKDPQFAVAVMGLALTLSAAEVAKEMCDPSGWGYFPSELVSNDEKFDEVISSDDLIGGAVDIYFGWKK